MRFKSSNETSDPAPRRKRVAPRRDIYADEVNERVRTVTRDVSGLTLPTERTKPKTLLEQCIILLHGENKIGKSLMAMEFPDSLWLGFEPGASDVEIYGREPAHWGEFQQYVSLLLKTKRHPTSVIDTVDLAYLQCLEFQCAKLGIAHPADAGYGKGWNAVETEFMKQINRIAQSGRGIVFISHTEAKTMVSHEGGEFNRLSPTMSGQARKFVGAIADITIYCGWHKGDRYMILEGSESMDAGHRMKNHFRTPSGKRVRAIPMGDDEREAFANLRKAFNNQQKDTYERVRTAGFAYTPKPMTSNSGGRR